MNHSELSHMAGAVDDSTINIVVVIIIIITDRCNNMSCMNFSRYVGCATIIMLNAHLLRAS